MRLQRRLVVILGSLVILMGILAVPASAQTADPDLVDHAALCSIIPDSVGEPMERPGSDAGGRTMSSETYQALRLNMTDVDEVWCGRADGDLKFSAEVRLFPTPTEARSVVDDVCGEDPPQSNSLFIGDIAVLWSEEGQDATRRFLCGSTGNLVYYLASCDGGEDRGMPCSSEPRTAEMEAVARSIAEAFPSLTRFVAKITEVFGDGEIQRPGEAPRLATIGTPVALRDLLSTGPGSRMTIVLPAFDVTIELDELTLITPAEVIDPEGGTPVSVRLLLERGGADARLPRHEPPRIDFKIRTPTATCGVRGTEFRVDHVVEPEALTTVVVKSGAVEVVPEADPEAVEVLEDGESISVSPDGFTGAPVQADTDEPSGEESSEASGQPAGEPEGVPTWWWIAGGGGLLVLVALFLLGRARRRRPPPPPPAAPPPPPPPPG